MKLKRLLLELLLLLALLALCGALVGLSGIVSIKASSGHFAITEWVLQLGKRRSVSTHTLGMELGPLEDPVLVLKGAGLFEVGCRSCHGSPGSGVPRIARAMTPPPPALASRVGEYEPRELFYIVKHGIKFTGMPAWPSQRRDDEVRALVAFLLELPKLDEASYQRLAGVEEISRLPPLQPGFPVAKSTLATCARCHGADGNGRALGAFPRLAGQNRRYLENALAAYAEGRRHSGTMGPIAAALDAEQRDALAEHYSQLAPHAPLRQDASSRALEQLERGRLIAETGVPSRGVPSCRDCHGPATHRRNPAYPLLSGQHAEYLRLQLALFQNERRGGSPYAHIMRDVAAHVSSEQARDVAAYYASLGSDLSKER